MKDEYKECTQLRAWKLAEFDIFCGKGEAKETCEVRVQDMTELSRMKATTKNL